MAQWGPANKGRAESPAQLRTNPLNERKAKQDVANAGNPIFVPLMPVCGPPGEIVGYISPNPNSDGNSKDRQP